MNIDRIFVKFLISCSPENSTESLPTIGTRGQAEGTRKGDRISEQTTIG